MQRKTVLAAAFTAALLAFGAGAQAQTYTTSTITVAPPAPRTEVVPAARPGWVWAPGYYEYNGGQYAWTSGHWMRERAGYEYREPRWVQRGNGSWTLVGNSWGTRPLRNMSATRDYGHARPLRRRRAGIALTATRATRTTS